MVVIVRDVGAVTFKVNCLLTLVPLESVTCTVMETLPVPAGFPVTLPSAETEKPLPPPLHL